MLMAEYKAYSGIWLAGWRLWVGDGPTVSNLLRNDLDRWIDSWGAHFFLNDEEWDANATRDEWHDTGWQLFARCNRELNPQGFLVLAAFETHPNEFRIVSEDRSAAFGAALVDRASAEEVERVMAQVAEVERTGRAPSTS
jgi:hypothetical protein